MSDECADRIAEKSDLRDRIAAVLGGAEVVLDGWDYLNETSKFLLADAVIRELGLRKDTYELLTRYVTEWTTTNA